MTIEPIEQAQAPQAPQESVEEKSPLQLWVEQQDAEVGEPEKIEEVQKEEVEEIEEEVKEIAEEEVEKQEDPKEDELISSRMAELARREYEVVQEKKRIKEESEKYKSVIEGIDELKKSPKRILEELGYDFESFTSTYLDEIDGKEKVKTAEEMVKELAEENNRKWQALEQEKQEAQRIREQEVIESYKKKIEIDLSSEENADKFELVNLKGAYDVVFDVVNQHFQKTEKETGTGEVLDLQKAAQIVEDYFLEEAQTFLKSKKLAKKEESESEVKPVPEKKKTVTLSNQSIGGAIGTNVSVDLSSLEATEESKQKAASVLRWTD